MTINDLLDSEWFLILVLVAIAIYMFFAMPSIYAKVAMKNKNNNDIYGNEPGVIRKELNVKIISKIPALNPLNQSVIVVFELENGNRAVFKIKDQNTYGVMVEGDHGTLKYQGKKFIGFERYN